MGRFLFEGKFKERRVETPERIFDILDQIKKGDWITIGYVTSADLNVPKVQRRNPLTNRMKGYDDYSVFGNENGEIAGLVKISAWNFRYYNRHDVSSRYYNEYKPSVNAIRGDYGLDPMADKEGYTQTMNYGKGGVSVYGGGNEALQGHSYAPQNVANVKPRSTVYPIGQDGKILNFNGLSQEQIIPYLKAAREVDGVSKLRKMEVEDEKIQEYIKRIKELNFSYKNFEQNSILWVAATVNGEALVYLNPNMTRVVNDITINTGDFLKIAANRYGKELDDIIRKSEQDRNMSQPMPESRKRYLRLTESDLRQVVREAATKIIRNIVSEARSFKNNQHYTHFAVSKKTGKIVTGWDYNGYDPEELRRFKKDYFDYDLIEYCFDPKNFRILSYKYLVRNGLNPDDNANWANNDETNAEFTDKFMK